MENCILTDKTYLSEIFSELPSNVLLNKGVTGCGGTYVELNSNRNSLILVPTIELAKNKSRKNFLVVYGAVTNQSIKEYLQSDIEYKKVIGTYDCLERLITNFPEILNYFLLIDEYHVLFNSYAFRNKAILYILKSYNLFKDFCFMTATPLNEDIILSEIKELPRVNIEWKKAVPIKLNLKDVSFTTKELLRIISNDSDCNYHIFLNSVKTIKDVITKLNSDNYRVVCSSNADRTKSIKISSTLDPVAKYNFYTSTAFEGCDIYDPIGKTIILCDTNIATTILDISTLVRQICGRLRDSIYKEEITLILNSGKHRYAGISKETFKLQVQNNIRLGQYNMEMWNNNPDPTYREIELRKYSDTFHSMYLNRFGNEIFFDDNLRKMDEYNYDLITQIYKNSISVIKAASENNMLLNDLQIGNSSDYWTLQYLENREYTYKELEEIFVPIFKDKGLNFTSKSLKDYFPKFEKSRKIKNKIRDTYYKFKNENNKHNFQD